MEQVGSSESMQGERTTTFEAKLDEVAALSQQVADGIRAGLHALNAAQDAFENDMRRCESDDRHVGEEISAFRRNWLLLDNQPFNANNAELAFIGDQLAEEEGRLERDEFVEEAIVGRKVHRGVLYYKVIWRGRNCVTWEREVDIDNKAMVRAFEDDFLARAMMPRTSRLRPATYISRRLRAANPALRERIDAVRRAQGGRAIWLCEVEPFIWIPYDDDTCVLVERAFSNGATNASIAVNNATYTIHFDDNLGNAAYQVRSDGSQGSRRAVRRIVQLSPDDEVELMRGMSIDELREYIATIPEILPHHYEALQRFHDADKVQLRRSTSDLLQSLSVSTFGDVLQQVADGVDVPCFTSECFVCLEDYEAGDDVARLICGHFFHRTCAFEYFERYSRLCPICKAEVV